MHVSSSLKQSMMELSVASVCKTLENYYYKIINHVNLFRFKQSTDLKIMLFRCLIKKAKPIGYDRFHRIVNWCIPMWLHQTLIFSIDPVYAMMYRSINRGYTVDVGTNVRVTAHTIAAVFVFCVVPPPPIFWMSGYLMENWAIKRHWRSPRRTIKCTRGGLII